MLNLSDLTFPHFTSGYDKERSPLPDIVKSQELIGWADHIVWVYPTWWYTIPALLKSFFEQVFIPGFAFKYIESRRYVKWGKQLKRKTSLLISAMDAPRWYYKLFIGDPGYKTMKHSLKYCGFSQVKRSYVGSLKVSDVSQRKNWLDLAERLGAKPK